MKRPTVRLLRHQLGVAMVMLSASSTAWSQVALTSGIQAAVNQILENLSAAEQKALTTKIEEQQQATRAKVLVQQTELEKTIRDISNSPEAKAATLDARQTNLRESKKTFAALEGAKRTVQGEAIAKPIAEKLSSNILESILLLSNPSLPLCGEKVSYRGDASQVSWNLTIDKFLTRYGGSLKAVGRIEIEEESYVTGSLEPKKVLVRTPIGTGFAIGPNRIATAGHVAQRFWDFSAKRVRDSVKGIYFNPGAEHKYNCALATGVPASVRLAGVRSTKYEPSKSVSENLLDFAVLELEKDETPLVTYLPLATTQAALSSFVLVVGYPSQDSRVERGLWQTVMKVPVAEGMFPVADIKRVSPGTVLPACSNAKSVHVSHDATTLNRTSGAPILSADTGEVVGIQIAGTQFGLAEGYCNLGLRSDWPEVELR